MSNFTKRLIFGILYILLIVIATSTNLYIFYGLFFVFMLFSIYEFKKMIALKSYTPYFIATGFFIASLLINTNNSITGKSLFILSILSIFISFITTLLDEKKVAVEHLGKITLTIVYTILPFLFIIELPLITTNFNPELVLGSFILVWSSDTFAYLIGKQFGKTKLFERISPKKTMEGLAGGIFFTLITAYILSLFFTNILLIQWLIISVIISIFGVIGDLVESMFKRQANVKDSSNLIPGHGGFLDRLDSIIFSIPFIYAFVYITNNLNL